MAEGQGIRDEVLRSYRLGAVYEELILRVRQCAPPGLTEAFGTVNFIGVPDFRLRLGKYRVIEVAPLATRIAVFMPWSRVFQRPEIYDRDPDFVAFEDAFGFLGVDKLKNQLWNVRADTDLSDMGVTTFLECGMRLVVKEIRRMHPAVAG